MSAPKTYVALTTPPTEGGISLIQLIGSKSRSIIRQVFQSKHKSASFRSNRIYLGNIVRHNEKIDEVIIRRVPARKSFTGLETIEINCHGGPVVTKKIIRLLKQLGAKQISAKQLINLPLKTGKIDRFQQEALAELLKAKTNLAAEVLLSQYRGALSQKIKQLTRLAQIRLRRTRRRLIKESKSLLATAPLGLSLCRPKKILLAGRPNTGKSTLFNCLVGKERVLTHHLPGTTRDAVEELVAVEEIPFRLIDSAGLPAVLPEKKRVIEKLSGRATRQQIKQADFIILLLDGSVPLQAEDKSLITLLKNKPFIPVVNKIDRLSQSAQHDYAADLKSLLKKEPICLSALTGRGVDSLKQALLEISLSPDVMSGQAGGCKLINRFKPARTPVIFTGRQYRIVKNIFDHVGDYDTISKIVR